MVGPEMHQNFKHSENDLLSLSLQSANQTPNIKVKCNWLVTVEKVNEWAPCTVGSNFDLSSFSYAFLFSTS